MRRAILIVAVLVVAAVLGWRVTASRGKETSLVAVDGGHAG